MADFAIVPMEEVETGYYLRVHAVDKPGVLSDITTILGDQEISIEAIIQKEPAEDARIVPVILLTQKVPEKNMNEAIRKIEALESISGRQYTADKAGEYSCVDRKGCRNLRKVRGAESYRLIQGQRHDDGGDPGSVRGFKGNYLCLNR
jgi:hypothetical protein